MIKINELPYWWDAARPAPSETIDLKNTCDAVIVGAGYAGLSAAITLSRSGRSVQVCDRLIPGEGASTRNGGLASGNIKISFGNMIKKFGIQRAILIYREGITARKELFAFIKKEGLACDFELNGRYVAAFTQKHFDAQSAEKDLLNKYLHVDAYMVPKTEQHTEIATDMYFGGMVRTDLGGLHPAKFHAGLLQLAKDAGAVIHGETPVISIKRSPKGFKVKTSRGQILAGDVIVSTNGYTDRFDRWLQRRLIPVKSRIIATEPLPKSLVNELMPKKRMFGESRTLFHYFRPSPDGTRILIGGSEGNNNESLNQSNQKLKDYLSKIFPQLSNAETSHSWEGNVAFNMDFIPRLFSKNKIMYATGFCGSGVVWAWWVGRKAAMKLLNHDEAATAFDGSPPMALPFYSGKPWFLPAVLLWHKLNDKFGATSKK